MKKIGSLKSLSFLALFLILIGNFSSCSSSKSASTSGNFIAPGYVKKDYKKILVLSTVKQEMYQKKIEDAVVSEFKERRYPVHVSYKTFPEAIKKDTAKLRELVVSEGYDAALVLTYLGEMSSIQENAHYNGNIYSVFYGTSEVYAVDTRNAKAAFFQCDFYIADKIGTQWRAPINVSRDNDLDVSLQLLARSVRQKILGDKIL